MPFEAEQEWLSPEYFATQHNVKYFQREYPEESSSYGSDSEEEGVMYHDIKSFEAAHPDRKQMDDLTKKMEALSESVDQMDENVYNQGEKNEKIYEFYKKCVDETVSNDFIIQQLATFPELQKIMVHVHRVNNIYKVSQMPTNFKNFCSLGLGLVSFIFGLFGSSSSGQRKAFEAIFKSLKAMHDKLENMHTDIKDTKGLVSDLYNLTSNLCQKSLMANAKTDSLIYHFKSQFFIHADIAESRIINAHTKDHFYDAVVERKGAVIRRYLTKHEWELPIDDYAKAMGHRSFALADAVRFLDEMDGPLDFKVKKVWSQQLDELIEEEMKFVESMSVKNINEEREALQTSLLSYFSNEVMDRKMQAGSSFDTNTIVWARKFDVDYPLNQRRILDIRGHEVCPVIQQPCGRRTADYNVHHPQETDWSGNSFHFFMHRNDETKFQYMRNHTVTIDGEDYMFTRLNVKRFTQDKESTIQIPLKFLESRGILRLEPQWTHKFGLDKNDMVMTGLKLRHVPSGNILIDFTKDFLNTTKIEHIQKSLKKQASDENMKFYKECEALVESDPKYAEKNGKTEKQFELLKLKCLRVGQDPPMSLGSEVKDSKTGISRLTFLRAARIRLDGF